MIEYFVPTKDSKSELVEKRSRFLGHLFCVQSEEQARSCIETIKKTYHDARHNCWCYRLQEGGIERYSDDGEPQGTAGQPMLNVFQRKGVSNVCCVVTRYFGGVLLGAGGLVRAYTQAAKDSLDAAGISVVRRWIEVSVDCPYALFEQMKLEVEGVGGVMGKVEYTEQISLHALLPEDVVDLFSQKVTERTAGGCAVLVVGESFHAVPRD